MSLHTGTKPGVCYGPLVTGAGSGQTGDSRDSEFRAAFGAGAPTRSSLRLAVLEGRLSERLGAEPTVPVRLGRFELRDRIGAGGMGAVYLAHDPALDRGVAIKLLHGWTSSAPQALIAEAQALARLSHENIVEVYGIGVDDDEPATLFVAMEYVPGLDLERWLQTAPTWREVARAFVDAGRGLASAHASGVLHGDFKPANVLRRENGRIKVIDFGLAKIVEQLRVSQSDTHSGPRDGPTGGTLGYCAPEKLEGGRDTHASDQFSFCVAAYRGLCGRLPFGAASRSAFAAALARGPSHPLPRHIPRDVAQVLARGMHRDPSARWPDMATLVRELESAVGRRPRWSPWLGVGIGLVLATAVWVAGTDPQQSPDCSAADSSTRDLWHPERRRAVQSSFEAAPQRFVVEAAPIVVSTIDAYVERLAAARIEICETRSVTGRTGTATEASSVCLESREDGLDRFLSRIERAEGLAASIAASHALERVAPCLRPDLDTARTRFADERRHRVDQVDASLQALGESYAAGTSEGGAKRAKQLLVASTELGYEPGRARALNLLGAFSSVDGRIPEAHGFFESAYFAAQSGRDDELALKAVRNLVSNASRRGDYLGALYWARQGRARIGSESDPIEVAKLEYAESIALISLGRTDDALDRLRRVLETRSWLLGTDHPQTADAQFEIGNAQLAAGDLEAALASYDASRSKHERSLGAHHPSLAFVHHNVGNVQFHLGSPDAARKSWERALEIEEGTLGADDARLGGTLANLATAANEADDPERALVYAERSQAILEAAYGSQHPDLIQTLTESGKAHLALGRTQAGKAAFEAAIEIGRGAFDGQHEAMLGPLAGAARAAWMMGDADATLRHSRQLLELEGFSSGDPGAAADALWVMARAQLAAGQTREAQRTAKRAVTSYSAVGDDDSVTAVTTWLEALDD